MKINLNNRIKGIFYPATCKNSPCNSGYVKEVTKQINNKSAAALAEQELYSHILDKADYYMELGYSKEQAFEKANEAMGDPEQTAASLNGLHGTHWYKIAQNYFSLLLLIAELAVFIFFENFFNYSSEAEIMHRISVDFISLVFLVSSFLLIRYAGKHNNKFICLCTTAFLGFQLFDNMLEPALYAAAKIFTSGFSGYTDSIYAYGLIQADIKGFLSDASFVMVWILLIYCILSLWGILYRERGVPLGRLFKPGKFVATALCVILAVNTAVMLCCCAVAYISIDDKISKNQALRSSAIDFVLNTDISKDLESIEKAISERGFSPVEKQENKLDFYSQYVYSKGNTQLVLLDDATGSTSMIFAVMSARSNFCLLNENLGIDQSIADEFAEKMTQVKLFTTESAEFMPVTYTSEEDVITLDEFLDKGFYKNAHTITKDFNCEDGSINIHFVFLLENSQYKTVDFNFENDRLTNLHFLYELE